MRFTLAGYLWDVAAGADGFYAGTCVIQRFTDAHDQLLRLDPRTLTVRTRAFFPGMVSLVTRGPRLWATIGSGDVVRLNPRTLAVEARRHVVSRLSNSGEEAPLYSPAIGLDSLWVLTGDRLAMSLTRLDPTTLAIRSRTRLPRSLAASVFRIIADSSHVDLVGRGIVPVTVDGRIGRAISEPNLESESVAVYGPGFLGVNLAGTELELLDSRGRVRARTGLREAGGPFAIDGRDLWLAGNAGRGFGLVHVRLTR